MTTVAAHHATVLFIPWLAAAVFLRIFTQRNTHKPQLLVRFSILILFAGISGLAVIWPFWNWGRDQVIQTVIDHSSRHNFFADPSAAGMFLLPVYGLMIPFIPAAAWAGRHKRLWGLAFSFTFLFILGLGGTTPLPHLLFGSGWAWLTYDRFALWASMCLLPLFGILISLAHTIRTPVLAVFWAFMAGTALAIGFMPSWLPTQPRQLDMQSIVNFLSQEGHDRYRYLTFGFGDQLAYLSRLTAATTIDGSYHTARTLPELRASGIGQIDSAFWFPNGLDVLDPILRKSSERGVRWAFVNLADYTPVLLRNGWLKLFTLRNNVQVWENPFAGLPPIEQPTSESSFTQFSWGVFPLASFLFSTGLVIRRYWQAYSVRVFSTIQVFAIGLLPFGLTFWYFRTIFAFPYTSAYFTYTDALFFLSDALVIIAVLAWLGQKRFTLPPGYIQWSLVKEFSKTPGCWLFCLCLLGFLSMLWSLDWRISLYTSIHTWLLYIFYTSLRDTPLAWRWFMLGCCAAICAQIIIGFWQFAAQSTAIIPHLGLAWPGSLLPSISGASVVQLANGVRWLRAYGTLPHPNLLGGIGFVLLAGPLAFYQLYSKTKYITLTVFGLGIALLVLTFSRSSWLGVVILFAVLAFHWRFELIKKMVFPVLTALIVIGILAVRLFPLFFTRLANSQVPTEKASLSSRFWAVQRSLELIRLHPLLGTGAATNSLALSRLMPVFDTIEPVHNTPLLITSELGIGGLFLLAGLLGTILPGVFHARGLPAAILSGSLLGLCAISFLDHYLWSLAPGRILFVTVLGIWAGQMRIDERSR
jgi:O-antigen ligase